MRTFIAFALTFLGCASGLAFVSANNGVSVSRVGLRLAFPTASAAADSLGVAYHDSMFGSSPARDPGAGFCTIGYVESTGPRCSLGFERDTCTPSRGVIVSPGP